MWLGGWMPACAGMTLMFFLAIPVLHATQAYVEIPVVFTSRYTPAGYTDLSAGIGIGYTHFPLEFFSFRLGYGALTTFSPVFWQGTKEVYVSGLEQDIEGRAYLGYTFEGSVIAFCPYVFLGAHTNLSHMKLVAFTSSDRIFRADGGFRGGLGVQVRFGEVAFKIDSAAGFGTAGLNLRTMISIGFGIF